MIFTTRSIQYFCFTLFAFAAVAEAQNVPACVTDGQLKLSAALSKKPSDLAAVHSDSMMCIIKNPSSAAALRFRATVERERGESGVAIEWFDQAIKLEPINAEGYSGRGSAYVADYRKSMSRKDLKDLGIADFNKALELDPKQADAILELVMLKQDSMGSGYLSLIPEYNRAIEIFRARNNPRSLARALSKRGSAYSLSTKYNEAIADYTEALKTDPTRYDDYMNRSIAHMGMKNTAAQLQDLTSLINSPEPTVFAYSSRGGLYEQVGDLVKAVADYRAALKLDPSNGYIKDRLPKLEARLPAAAPVKAPVASDQSKKAEELGIEGRKFAEAGEFDRAIASLDECIKIKPDLAPCFMFRGGAHAHKGNQLLALADMDRAVALMPNHPAPYFSRGVVNAQFGKKNEAITDFRAVLKFDPNNTRAKQVLTQLGAQP